MEKQSQQLSDRKSSKVEHSNSLVARIMNTKKKEKKVFPEIKWDPITRPKPVSKTFQKIFYLTFLLLITFIFVQELNESMWRDPEVREELIRYISWHQLHPHCITPREVNKNQVLMSEQKLDEDNPNLFYSPNPNVRDYLRLDPNRNKVSDFGADGAISGKYL